MTNEEINEKMVSDIEELLLKYNLFHGTKIYFNNKCVSDIGAQRVIRENIEVEKCQDWCNPKMISMAYEGADSFYLVVNGYAKSEDERKRANKITSELIKISERYNRYFELGTDTTLYFVSDDDLGTPTDKYYYGKESL